MSIVSKLMNQCKKPTGWLGRFNLWTMNSRHSKLTDWGLTHISISKHDTILDVGCGGGRTAYKLAAGATEGVATRSSTITESKFSELNQTARALSFRNPSCGVLA